MSEKKLVPEGAFLVCDKGTLPSQITSSSMEEVSIYGETVITEADKVFMVNFQPFGPCLCLHGQPCMAQPLMWDSLADGITIGEFAPVLEDAKLPCALGGQISIVLTPAVAFAQAPKQEKSFWDKTLDFGKGLGKGLWTGAKGTATGVYDLGVWAGKHSLPYMLLNPEGYKEQLQQDVETAKALGGLAADVGTWAYRNSAVNQLTNPADYAAVQQENAVMVGKVVEKAKAMDAEDWGNFTGQVGFEVLTEVATAGAGLVVTGMKAADRTVDVARAAEKIDDIADAARAAENAEDASDATKAGKAVEEGEDASDAARAADKAEDTADAAGPEKLGDVVYGGEDIPTRNQSLKDQRHPVTNILFEERTVTYNGVDYRGVFPKFESKFDAALPENMYSNTDYAQFKESTKQLKQSIEKNPSLRNQFTESQLEDIMDEEPYIDNLTWHHSEEPAKLELVDREIHSKTAHTGGRNIWGGGSHSR